jgi:hypothetical protein
MAFSTGSTDKLCLKLLLLLVLWLCLDRPTDRDRSEDDEERDEEDDGSEDEVDDEEEEGVLLELGAVALCLFSCWFDEPAELGPAILEASSVAAIGRVATGG